MILDIRIGGKFPSFVLLFTAGIICSGLVLLLAGVVHLDLHSIVSTVFLKVGLQACLFEEATEHLALSLT